MTQIDEVFASIKEASQNKNIKSMSSSELKEVVREVIQGITSSVLESDSSLTLVNAGKFYRKENKATSIEYEGEAPRKGKDATEYVAFKSVSRKIENYTGEVRVVSKNNFK